MLYRMINESEGKKYNKLEKLKMVGMGVEVLYGIRWARSPYS